MSLCQLFNIKVYMINFMILIGNTLMVFIYSFLFYHYSKQFYYTIVQIF
jgi:hypothetical protein